MPNLKFQIRKFVAKAMRQLKKTYLWGCCIHVGLLGPITEMVDPPLLLLLSLVTCEFLQFQKASATCTTTRWRHILPRGRLINRVPPLKIKINFLLRLTEPKQWIFFLCIANISFAYIFFAYHIFIGKYALLCED